MHEEPAVFFLVPDHFKTEEMCIKALEAAIWQLKDVPDHFKTQEMCIKAVEVDPWQLGDVPDHIKTQEICNKAVKDYLFSLRLVPDWFVTQQKTDVWYDDDYVYNDNKMIEWYKGYKKRKEQKAKLKDELVPTAWHPSRWLNGVFLKMRKKI